LVLAFPITRDAGDPCSLLWSDLSVFPISRSRAITGSPDLFATLCLRPSARTPPPISVLLKTKAKPQFDRTVDRAVEAFFTFLRASIRLNFSLVFSLLLSGRQRVAAGEAARRKIGVPDEPAVGLAGWKIAAPQPVIVSERRSLESNDPKSRSEQAECWIAECWIFKDLPTPTPWGWHTLADSCWRIKYEIAHCTQITLHCICFSLLHHKSGCPILAAKLALGFSASRQGWDLIHLSLARFGPRDRCQGPTLVGPFRYVEITLPCAAGQRAAKAERAEENS
jgi:hypothetical protein